MSPLSTKFHKLLTSSGSVSLPCVNGTLPASSRPLAHQEACASLTSHPLTSRPSSPINHPSLVSSSIPGSLLTNKKTIFPDNNLISQTIFLTNLLPSLSSPSLTSHPVSISRDPACCVFWDSSNKELYQQLSWLPETDLPALDSNSLSGCVKSLELNSWFSTLKIQPQNQNSEKTSCPLFKFTAVDGMAGGDTLLHPLREEKLKALKLRLCPTPQQKMLLQRWAGCQRFLYNKTIGLLTNPKNQTLRDKFRIRNRLVNVVPRSGKDKGKDKAKNSFYLDKPWLEQCPKTIRASGVFEACENYKACLSNLRAGNIHRFRAPHKTKKREIQAGWSYTVEKQYIHREGNHLKILGSKLGEMKYRSVKQLKKLFQKQISPLHDCKIQKTAFGEYFLVVPRRVVCKPPPQEISNPVAGDPGIRKFLTTYAPNSRESFMMGNRWSTDIMKLLVQLDHLYSEKAKNLWTTKKETVMKERLIRRMRKRVFYLKQELRNQCAHFLAKRYDMVLLPKLDVKGLSGLEKRKLKTKTVRAMLQAGHGAFFQAVKSKCEELGCGFMEVPEAYTSQTCPCCGKLNKCGEVYACKECKYRHDRDMTGALNILLRAVRKENPQVAH